ncbi:unknown protein [Cronobacter turicensis z3032]|uniref:Uncharacterized protein n=1 Tax=Cronobacter turicensis (strain DSM 18703 / CCUG 55852 / LMG 23827 / z3032) TaxID=693216 RepID=C9Y1P8_CROTZ|nr:unknown protein [Cronobacter turicensis z3032]
MFKMKKSNLRQKSIVGSSLLRKFDGFRHFEFELRNLMF